MKTRARILLLAPLMLFAAGFAHASKYSDTIALFKNAGDSAGFFQRCFAYAVFPPVGDSGCIGGGARGTGHVCVPGR